MTYEEVPFADVKSKGKQRLPPASNKYSGSRRHTQQLLRDSIKP